MLSGLITLVLARRQWRHLWLLLWGCLGLMVAAQARLQVQDDRGQTVALMQPAQRVVSLLPSLTETVCLLGGCARLVGVDRYSNWPASVRALPRLGGGLDPNIEAIVAARPDVVLLAGSTRGAQRLEALGLTVLRLEPRSLADVKRVLQVVGVVLGVSPTDTARIWQDMQAAWAASASAVPSQMLGKRVYFEVSPVPYGAGPSSFIGETLAHLGLVNILPDNTGPYPKINPEWVVRAQPDIIMLSDSTRQSMAHRPGWLNLSAVQEDRLCVFDQAASDVLVRAGPRLAEAARLVVGCLQRLDKAAKP